MGNFRELVLQNRSYRRFDNSHKISDDELLQLLELVRFVPSAANKQAHKYILVSDDESCKAVFPHLGWAGYLKDWKGPEENERPTAYIVVLKDKSITENTWCDDGLAIQTIMLGATERNLGGCIMGNVNRKELSQHFNLPSHLEISYVLALGKPKEVVILKDIIDDDVKYWRSEDGTHHVPKRRLNDLIYK